MKESVKIGLKNPLTKEYLLLKRISGPDKHYPGKWDIVGGVVEDGETIEEALMREKNEEIGKDIQIYDIIMLGKFSLQKGKDPKKQPEMNLTVYLGTTTASLDELKLTEHETAGYFPLEKILTQLDTMPFFKEVIEHYKKKIESYCTPDFKEVKRESLK